MLSDWTAASKRPARACSMTGSGFGSPLPPMFKRSTKKLTTCGVRTEARSKRSVRAAREMSVALVASVRGPIARLRLRCYCRRLTDAERTRDLTDLPSVGADHGAGDVVARGQERQRDRALERATIRRVGGGRLHAAGGAVECPRLLILRDLEHHRRVLQDIRRFGVQLDVVGDRARRELAADDRLGAARSGLLVGDQQIGGAHFADLGQAGAE